MQTSTSFLKKSLLAFYVLFMTMGISNNGFGQCGRPTCNYIGDPAAATSTWQYVSGSVADGTTYNRYDFYLYSGNTYAFSLCSADGGAADYDSYLCLYGYGYGCGYTTFLASNDDNCGVQSKITYTATSTGWTSLYISGYGTNYGTYTLAYRYLAQGTATTTINYSGFVACNGGQCYLCGQDYWCTNTPDSWCGDTPPCDTKTFFDPVPAGNTVTSVTVNYWTSSCSGAIIYGTINSFSVPVAYDGNTGCLCSSNPCSLTTSVSSYYPCGLTGYVYGGYNTFTLCSSDDMCINRAELVFTYYPTEVVIPSIAPSNPTICTGGSVTLDAGAGYSSYYWNTGATTQTINVTPTTSGTYSVTVSSPLGCVSNSASTYVTVVADPSITIYGATTICSGGTASLTSSSSGGTGTCSYQWQSSPNQSTWTNVATTQNYTTAALTSTTYYRCIRTCDGLGCNTATSNTVMVTVNTIPSAVTVYGGGTQCGGSRTLTATGGTGGTIYWQGTTSGGTSTATPSTSQTVSASGTYYFRAYNSCGWGTQGSTTITINTTTTLISDSPVTTNSYPTYYQYQNWSNMTAVVAIAPQTSDHDIYIYDNACGSGTDLISSTYGGTYVDFAICYYGNSDILFPSAEYGSSGVSIVEYEEGTGMGLCSPVSGTMQTSEAVDMYEIYLTSGTSYDVKLDITSGACNLGFALGYTTTFLNRGSCQLDIDVNGASGDEIASSWACPETGYYGLVVYNTYTGNPASNYNITICATPGAVTVNGGGTYCNSATLTASGGTGGTIYWQGTTSNGTSTATPSTSQTVTSSGTYYFRAFNGIGWGAEGSATVTITAPVTQTITGITPICVGSSQTWTSTTTGGSWTTSATSIATVGSSTGIVTGVSAGTATINYSVTTSGGCVNTATKTVTINAIAGAVTVNGAGTYCNSQTLTATGGTNGTIYWQGTTSNGTSTSTPATSQSVSTTGTYYFRAYNANCGWGAQGSAAVTVNSLPGNVAVYNGGTQCGGSRTLTATGGSGGSGYILYWQNTTSSGTSTATPATSQSVSSSGTYYFRAYAPACGWGTQGYTSVTIGSPITQTISGITPICIGSSQTWTSTTSGGTWSSAATAVATVGSSTGVVTGVSAGTATITYSVTVDGCVNTATKTVTINAIAGAVTINGGSH
ncbi:MAG TPA: hypothetical protein PKW80_16250 [Bacteroidales bacterium]|nr:hypothetical protein [Bacteroidales bacterium]